MPIMETCIIVMGKNKGTVKYQWLKVEHKYDFTFVDVHILQWKIHINIPGPFTGIGAVRTLWRPVENPKEFG